MNTTNEDIKVIRKDLLQLSDGRVCYPFPWESTKTEQPWRNGYSRVMIPLTETEKINSNKKCHVQIVRNNKLSKVREVRITL